MSAERARSLSAAQVDALLAPLARAKSVLIAVSGGPDSTALLIMAAEWAARRGRGRVAAATVDHGLRPESAAEAKGVAALCRRLLVDHRTLPWEGAKPASRVQERAREARYRLLLDHARAIGAEALVTAHHADDQAETVLFRLIRGSGLAGLRGMEAMTARDGVTIARPLIGVKKRDLVAFCRARRAAFVDDRSNTDPRYARTRLRALISRLSEEGLDTQALDRLARRAGETEDALGRLTALVESKLGAEGAIDAHALYAEPIAIVQRILAARVAAAGGRDSSRIGLEKIEALAAALRDAVSARRAHVTNVGGAMARLTAKGVLSFAPEPARRGGRQ